MPTLDRLSPNAFLSWFRTRIHRLWRTMMARRPAVRVGLVLAPVLGLAAAGYWAAAALAPAGTRYLASGRSFSTDDVIRIRQALDAKGVSYRVYDRKVEVAAEQYDQANEAFSKLHVGPTTVDELRNPPDWFRSLVETSQDRERNERIFHQKMIEHGINELPGVVSSVVTIGYPRPSSARYHRAKPTALVTLETEANRLLPSRTLRAILTIVMRNEPELSEGSITVMGLDGQLYVDPSNPKLGDSSRDRAREEEVRRDILEKLSYIKDVQVWVQLMDRLDESAPASSAGAEPTRAGSVPAIGVNRPIELEEPAPPAVVAANPAAPPRADRAERGRVLITVPRSYYYNHMLPSPDERPPTQDELRGMAARTEEQIVKLVKMAVAESWSVDVDMYADDVPLGRRAVLPAGSDSRRKVADWGIVAAGAAAAVALLTALASWFQAMRRPARLPEPQGHTRRYRADSGEEANPSERVRELVRRDPEAAASVLQRWATQGGHVS